MGFRTPRGTKLKHPKIKRNHFVWVQLSPDPGPTECAPGTGSCILGAVSQPASPDLMNQFSRERLRFAEFDHQISASGKARVRVVLADREVAFTGEAVGVETREGAARAAALATLAAAKAATGQRFDADLIGVKLVRAFDAWIVVTALRAHTPDRTYRLIGSAEAPGEDTTRGAVLSVLDAMNRVLDRFISSDE